ncbi:hypothetical protein UA08_04696 [Talaromyces atroroseus]|uniref:Uncharacterized protein n=1 Tax=Talaromyces atroroseus TaxID=1441469 RepID=A0A225ANZ6_TALAT|nr:hypothetical protein UA08_04696 [Talaromyces atroroseus]OKL60104.1 hypothetical protein UA08_04696 [Talaromyces atroroseus]
MSRKTIFLMGAPSGRLEWNGTDLLETAVPPFKSSGPRIGTSSETKWRVLQRGSGKQSSSSIWTGNTLFLDTTNLIFKIPRTSDDVLSQFYEHSLSILGASYSSESDNNDTTLALDDSDIDESMHLVAGPKATTPSFDFPNELHDIKDIPNAAYLRSIIPQTPSVTLVVAIVGINPLRRVTARHSKQELDILELIVGDETRTGFGVTFWLPLSKGTKETHGKLVSDGNSEFREKICSLRPRDIVLIRNVGLGSFRDLVYGQSLRRGMTKVDLLHRQECHSTDDYGIYSAGVIDTASGDDRLLTKVRKVRSWLMNFVGIKAHYDSHSLGRLLPPDTQ